MLLQLSWKNNLFFIEVYMKRFAIILIMLLTLSLVHTDQTEDLKFIIGLYQDSNFRLAKTELLKFKDNYPASRFTSDADFLLANIYLKAQEYEKAQDYFEQLYDDPAVDINRPDVILGLAQTKFFQADLTGSAILLNTFINDYPEHEMYWNALYFLGRIAVEQREYDSASYYFFQAREINSSPQIDLAQLELYLLTNNYSEARQIMTELLAQHKNETITAQALIKLHNYNLKTRNLDEIMTLGYEAINAESPYYDDYKLLLGITRYEMKNYQQALADLKEIETPRSQYYQALCYVELNETVKAVDLFSLTQNAENVEISSNSFFYLARLTVDDETAINLLQEFINTYPNHIFLAAAYYQKGYHNFQLNNFSAAEADLQKALDLNLTGDSREKTIYLMAESFYLRDKQFSAYEGYNEYLDQYPEGDFADEALFKIGLYLYRQSNYPEAFIHFNRVIDEFPESSKVGMSRFYIGEMFFEQNKYFDAERYFLKASEEEVDKGLVQLRLAQINFYLREYQQAEENLPQIPDEPRYLFDKLILTGNLYFTQKDYSKALEAYDNALQYSPSNETERKVMNRKAWTLYQMRDYSRAAEIYRTLSLGEEGDPAYLLKAASSAFSAQNYDSAIELFEEFIAKYPDSEQLLEARIGLANSYYNAGNFVQAALYYRELINPEIDPEIMQNSLNGLRWSCEQDDSIDYLGIVNDILLQYDDAAFQSRLLQDKILYLYNQQMWKEVLQAYNQLDQSTAAAIRNDYFQIYQAIAMTELGYLDQAEQVFSLIDPEQRDADVYRAWADLKLIQNDETGAIEKLRSASQRSRDYDVWLPLLKLEQENDHEHFLNDYNKFGEFAGLQEAQQAELIWLRWKLARQEYAGLEEQVSKLAGSKYASIKAGSQLLKGLLLYHQADYDNAIPELLRVRYLYPEMGEVRIEAEYFACLAYIAAERKEEAEQLYELISAELTPEMKAEIESGLWGDE